MARNIWDVSDILLSQRAGDIYGNMFAKLGQQAGGAFQQIGEQKKQNKMMEGEIKSTVDFLEKARNLTKDDPERTAQIDQTLAQLGDPNANLIGRYTMAKGAAKNIIDLVSLGEATAKAEAQRLENEATRRFNAYVAQGMGAPTPSIGQGSAQAPAPAPTPAQTSRMGVIGQFSQMGLPTVMGSGAAQPSSIQATRAESPNIVADYIKAIGIPPRSQDDLMRFAQIRQSGAEKPSDKDVLFKAEVDNWNAANPGQTMPASVRAELARKAYGPLGAPIQVSLGSPPPGFSYTIDPISGRVSAQEIAGSPDIAKKETAKNTLSANVGSAIDNILQLNAMGAIVNPENDFLANIKARLSASQIGQGLGGAAGTRAQSIRNKLNNLTPVLIQEIKAATGLSSQELNSNVELQFRIKQVGDDSMDIVSRLAALDNIDRNYGSGKALDEALKDNPDLIAQVRGSLTEVPAPESQTKPGDSQLTEAEMRELEELRKKHRKP